mmetsp:Transcript_7255/g.13768  ORF Transcript_7255/g.13768 Transcript_7255/m.13768 type:complete len:416 (+) Transcript_7255:963-2210(+)
MLSKIGAPRAHYLRTTTMGLLSTQFRSLLSTPQTFSFSPDHRHCQNRCPLDTQPCPEKFRSSPTAVEIWKPLTWFVFLPQWICNRPETANKCRQLPGSNPRTLFPQPLSLLRSRLTSHQTQLAARFPIWVRCPPTPEGGRAQVNRRCSASPTAQDRPSKNQSIAVSTRSSLLQCTTTSVLTFRNLQMEMSISGEMNCHTHVIKDRCNLLQTFFHPRLIIHTPQCLLISSEKLLMNLRTTLSSIAALLAPPTNLHLRPQVCPVRVEGLRLLQVSWQVSRRRKECPVFVPQAPKLLVLLPQANLERNKQDPVPPGLREVFLLHLCLLGPSATLILLSRRQSVPTWQIIDWLSTLPLTLEKLLAVASRSTTFTKRSFGRQPNRVNTRLRIRANTRAAAQLVAKAASSSILRLRRELRQ